MITPILHRVLIKPIELKKSHKVEGTDIELDLSFGSAQDEKRHEAARIEGHVVALGPTAFEGQLPRPTSVGDHVVFAKYAGLYVNDPETDETYVLINDEDILCVVRKGDK
jgi:co-chaperonin GroES (HSP10)